MHKSIVWLSAFNFISAMAMATETQVAGVGLEGAFSVSSMGAATYSIPIEMPPAIGGYVPQISLVYNSQSGYGIAGYGWNIGGLSSIARCPQSRLYEGAEAKLTLNYDNSDQFCLNGQRLIKMSGTAGQSGASYASNINDYSRVKYIKGQAEYFLWQKKSGGWVQFGGSESAATAAMNNSYSTVYSLILKENQNIFEYSPMAVSWYPVKESDGKGNYISYLYELGGAEGFAQLKRITFDFSGMNPRRYVDFVYEANAVSVPLYAYGMGYKKNNRLVGVKVGDVVVNSDNTVSTEVRRSYDLVYKDSVSMGAKLLESVKQCNWSAKKTDGTQDKGCLKSVVFTQNQNDLPKLASPSEGLLSVISKFDAANVWPGDYNGDGLTDIMSFKDNGFQYYKSLVRGGFDAVETKAVSSNVSVVTGDFDGDGVLDLGYVDSGGGLYACKLTGGYFPDACGYLVGLGSIGGVSDLKVLSGDVDGDGKSDVIRYAGGVLKVSKEYKNYLGGSVISLVDTDISSDWANAAFNWAFWIGNYNGDNLADIVTYNGTNLVCWAGDSGVGHAGKFVKAGSQVAGMIQSTGQGRVWPGDYNGDGLTDFMMYSGMSEGGFFKVWFGRGDCSFTETAKQINAGGPWDWTMSWSGDYNGDGLQDLASYSAGNFRFWMSRGDGTFKAVDQGNMGSGWAPTSSWTGDYNGDGMTDLVSYKDATHVITLANTTAPWQRITQFETEKSTYKINYASIVSDTEVYTVKPYAGTEPDYSQSLRPVILPLQVVKKVTSNTATGDYASNVFTEKYRDYVFQYRGLYVFKDRGMAGFRSKLTADLEGKMLNTDTYRQDYPYIGVMVESKTASCAAITVANLSSNICDILNSVSNIWNKSISIENANVVFPFIEQTLSRTYDPPSR